MLQGVKKYKLYIFRIVFLISLCLINHYDLLVIVGNFLIGLLDVKPGSPLHSVLSSSFNLTYFILLMELIREAFTDDNLYMTNAPSYSLSEIHKPKFKIGNESNNGIYRASEEPEGNNNNTDAESGGNNNNPDAESEGNNNNPEGLPSGNSYNPVDPYRDGLDFSALPTGQKKELLEQLKEDRVMMRQVAEEAKEWAKDDNCKNPESELQEAKDIEETILPDINNKLRALRHAINEDKRSGRISSGSDTENTNSEDEN